MIRLLHALFPSSIQSIRTMLAFIGGRAPSVILTKLTVLAAIHGFLDLVKPKLVASVGLLLAVGAIAQPVPTDQAEMLRKNISTYSQGKVAVGAITRTPVPGLFQVVSDGEILYVDASGRYSFFGGSMIDMKQQQDLTAAELDKVNAIPFDRLPLQHAIKEVHGNGSRHIAVFEDPNCPICKVFTKFLDQVDDVTIHRFMYPVIAPQSEALAQAAWCSRDRSAAWKSIMAGAKPATAGVATCDTSGLAAILKFGETHRINNTPTVVLASGKRLVGATPPEMFLQELEQGGRPAK